MHVHGHVHVCARACACVRVCVCVCVCVCLRVRVADTLVPADNYRHHPIRHSAYSNVPVVGYPMLVIACVCLGLVFRGVAAVTRNAEKVLFRSIVSLKKREVWIRRWCEVGKMEVM